MESWLESFARVHFTRSTDTAHDLKTPLNIAVLNLELMRMRIAKLGAEGDEKVVAYARSIELELRRMARIFDTFFLLSIPPKGEGPPSMADVSRTCVEVGAAAGFELVPGESFPVQVHESRIVQALKLFFEGAAHLFHSSGRSARTERNGEHFQILVSGTPRDERFEIEKIFKFYYTDPAGNPDMSLATARLIAETYGGELIATEERDTVVTLRLSFHRVTDAKDTNC
jgi:His Kinase A (phospho-acceptor) domain